MTLDDPDARSEQRHTVLNVFGLTLEVSNPRLAELLTMDAKEALTADIKEVFGPSAPAAAGEAQADAVDVVPSVDVRAAREEQERRALRERVRLAGERLGFDVALDGTWESPAGVSVLVRDFPRTLTLAAAAHFVRELAGIIARASDPDRTSALLVAADRGCADVLKVAVRQARAYQSMRVACIDDLESLAAVVERNAASHAHALAVIAPIAAIDVGEVVAVLRAAGGTSSSAPVG
ncbi:MAG: hypothetical protein QMD96_00875 [Anaerosomatales bacterium]|nr:hypothetical protein [Anaerosomatales bacterium]